MHFAAALAALSLAAPALAAQSPPEPAPADPRFRPTDVVSLRPADGVDGWAAVAATLAPGDPLAALAPLRTSARGVVDLRLPAGVDAEAAVARLAATGRVAFAERNWTGAYVGGGLPDDPVFPSQDHLYNVGQTGGAVDQDVDAELAWELSTGDPAVAIAILDSGVDTTHPDLVGNLWANPGEIPANGIDDDGNGFVDDVVGWDFEGGDPNPKTSGNHGTIVAGVVGARPNDGFGAAGIAGGWGATPGCSLMALAIGSFSPTTDLIDDALVYAADNGARVVTMSLTVPQTAAIDDALDYARNEKGVFVDCASGNGFFGAGPVSYPASNPDVVAVGGTTNLGTHWSSGNFGPEVLVSAQASNVTSTDLGGGTTVASGTSFAAPQAAAVAGLVLSVDPALSPAALEQVLRFSADDLETPGYDEKTGWGRVNARRALELVLENDCNANGLYDPDEIAAGLVPDFDGDGTPDTCQPLSADLDQASVSAGGGVAFALDAGPEHAGDLYFLLGSATGTTPGIDLGGVVVPLVLDGYLLSALGGPDTAPFAGFQGVLDAAGAAAAAWTLAPGGDPAWAGALLHHAFVTVDPTTFEVLSTSNALPLELVP